MLHVGDSVFDSKAHHDKVEKLKALEARREKNYWPYFKQCSTCDAPEGVPCYNMQGKQSRVGKDDSRYWSSNLSAHKGRYRMSKEEFKARQDELYKIRMEEHKKAMEEIKEYVAEKFGLYF